MFRIMNKEQIKKEKDAKNKIVANKKKAYNKPRKYPDKKREFSTQKRSNIKRAAAKNAAIKCNPFIREFPDKHQVIQVGKIVHNEDKTGRKAIIIGKKKNNIAIARLYGNPEGTENPSKLNLYGSTHKKIEGKNLSVKNECRTKSKFNTSLKDTFKSDHKTIISKNDSQRINQFLNTDKNKKAHKNLL